MGRAFAARLTKTRAKTFQHGPFVFRVVFETSLPWGLKKRNGTVALLAYCWGQAESTEQFMHFRILVLGPLAFALGRIQYVRRNARQSVRS